MNVAGGHRISLVLLPSHPAVQLSEQGVCRARSQHPSTSSQHHPWLGEKKPLAISLREGASHRCYASSGTTGEWPQCSLLTKYYSYSPVFPKLRVRVTCFFNPWQVGIAIVENETLTVIDRTGYLLISYSSSVLIKIHWCWCISTDLCTSIAMDCDCIPHKFIEFQI